ncbi:MAG TPA: hypothetical protein VK763_20725 [Terriglobales bacterium]|jgi:hypothetical protein|nr:hypothetical protein [Terriglobales bacterium]
MRSEIELTHRCIGQPITAIRGEIDFIRSFVRATTLKVFTAITFLLAFSSFGVSQAMPKWSTTDFAGADAGIRAQNCLNFLANMQSGSFDLGGVCTLEYESSIDMSVNPFAGTSVGSAFTPLRSELILSQAVQNKTEVPIVVANGTTYATNTEGMAELAGPGVGVGGNQNVTGGAMLKAGSNYPKAGSTTNNCSGCTSLSGTVKAEVDDTHSSNSDCGFTMSAATDTGRVCVVGVGTAFTTQVVGDGYMAIPYNNAANQVFGHIEQIIDNTHLVLTQQLSTAPAGGLGSGQTYSTTYPMVQMGVRGLPFSGPVNQGITVHDLSISTNGVAGSIALANYDAPEMNIAYNLHLEGYNLIGFDLEGDSNQTSRFHDIMFAPDSNTCQSYTTDLMVNASAPMGGDGLVLANGGQCPNNVGGSSQSTGIVLNGVNIKLDNIHTEQKTPALAIGYLPSCGSSAPCPGILYASSSTAAHNIVVDRMDSNCAIGGGCTDTVYIGNTFSAPFDVDLRSISTSGSSGITNTLHDVNLSNTLTQGGSPGNPSVSYHLDASGYPLVVAQCYQVSKGECHNNGLIYINGSILPTGPSMLLYSQSTSTTPSGTQYIPVNGIGNLITGTESSVYMLMPRVGTISALYVAQTANEGATSLIQFTLRKNGTSQSVTCTVGSSTHTCNDTAHSFTFAATDTLDIMLTQTNAGTSASIAVGISYY